MGHGHNNPNRARRELQRDRAEEAGRQAKLDGKERDANPHNQALEPQVWGAWDRGWWQA
jgi:hypothetical protein